MGERATKGVPAGMVGSGAVLCCLGIALIILVNWLGELTLDTSSVGEDQFSKYLSSACSSLTYVACAAGYRRVESWLASPGSLGALLAVGAVASIGRALALFCSLAGSFGWIAYVGVAVHSVAEAVVLLAWLSLCCRREPLGIPLVFPVAYALVSCTQFVLRTVNPWAVAVIAVLLPLASAVVYAAYRRGMAGEEDAETASAEGDVGVTDGAGGLGAAESSAARVVASARPAITEPAAKSSTAEPATAAPTIAETAHSAWSFPVRPVALMAVYSFVFYFSLALSEGPNPYGVLGMLLVSLTAVVAATVYRQRYAPTLLYKPALPLMVAGLVSLAYLGTGREIAVMFTNAGNVAFLLFILITLGTLCHHYGVSPVWMFGIVYAASKVASSVGQPLGEAFTGAFPVGSDTSRLVMWIIVVAMVVLSTFFFDDKLAAKSFGMVPTGTSGQAGTTGLAGVFGAAGATDAAGTASAAGQIAGESGRGVGGPGMSPAMAVMSYSELIVWRCSQVSRLYGLTQREEEVLELIVQGMSIGEVADKASISYGTAKTHLNHIYRKLDVHSREEAVALVGRIG